MSTSPDVLVFAKPERPTEYPQYLVFPSGRILGPYGKLLKPSLRGGYQRVSLRVDGRSKSVSVHVLVCLAFHGAKPSPDHEVAHRNDVKTDNRAENVYWATRLENVRDSIRNGVRARAVGELNGNAKLSRSQVAEIFALRESGLTQQQIADRMPVGRSMVSHVLNGRCW